MLAQSGLSAAAAAAAASAAALGLPAQAQAKLKVGFVMVGTVDDGGWNTQHNLGRLAVEEHFGGEVETVFQESDRRSKLEGRARLCTLAEGIVIIFSIHSLTMPFGSWTSNPLSVCARSSAGIAR